MKNSTITIISAIIGILLAISIIGGVVIYLNFFKPTIHMSDSEIHTVPHKMTYVNPETGASETFALDNNGNTYYESISISGAAKEISIANPSKSFYYDYDLDSIENSKWKATTNSVTLPRDCWSHYSNGAYRYMQSNLHDVKIKKIKSLSLDEATNEKVMDAISGYDYVMYKLTPKREITTTNDRIYSAAECVIDKETNMTLYFRCEYTDVNTGETKTECFLLDEYEKENNDNYSSVVSHLLKDDYR